MTTITEDLQSVKGTRIADMNRLSDADNVSVHELQEAIKNLQKKNERLKCELDRRKRVEARLKKKNAHLELIRRIQNDITMTGDIEKILNKAAESMGKMFGYSKVSVNLLDSARAEVVHPVEDLDMLSRLNSFGGFPAAGVDLQDGRSVGERADLSDRLKVRLEHLGLLRYRPVAVRAPHGG